MIVQYLLSIVFFVLIDTFWIGTIAKTFYRDNIGHLMSDQFHAIPAVLFYLIFLAGLNLFVISPHKKSGYGKVALYGAAFGFVTYSTFDLTCQAVFKDFPTLVVVVDLLWGSFLSMGISLGTVWASNQLDQWRDKEK